MNLLELSKDFRIKNFIFASSSSVYGNNKKVPFHEDDNVDYPISPYAASKKSCELMIHTYSHLYNINATCLRFFTVYGPRGRPDMVPHVFADKVMKGEPIVRYGDGSTSRDYTYVGDIVKGITSALDRNHKFEIINLGNSNPVKLSEVLDLVGKYMDKDLKIEERPMFQGDVLKTYADISKAKRLLDYNPEVSIDEGMKNFFSWYNQEQDKV